MKHSVFCIIIIAIISYTGYCKETFTILPPVNTSTSSQSHLTFVKHFAAVLSLSKRFSPVDYTYIKTNIYFHNFKNSSHDDIWMEEIGRLTGSAKVCYTEFSTKDNFSTFFIKIIDCQLGRTVMILNGDKKLPDKKFAVYIYNEMKKKLITRERYISLISEMVLKKETIDKIENAGGTIDAYHLLYKHGISPDEYIHMLLYAGSAVEFLTFIKKNKSSGYYLKYLKEKYLQYTYR
jgi:hypothetical protein